VNHDVLMTRVARRVKDRRVLRLIRRNFYVQSRAAGERVLTSLDFLREKLRLRVNRAKSEVRSFASRRNRSNG
jgi:hypothetical protein